MKKIAIFCGSSAGKNPVYSEIAMQLAEVLSQHKIILIYGGGKVGLMGVLADHMLKNNGQVIGVMPKSLVDAEIAHNNLTKLHIVNSMHERKALIYEIADGFIMLPGGTGSVEEFFESYTWAQLGYHQKPCGLINVNNYYEQLLKFLDHSVNEGFLNSVYRDMILVDNSPAKLLEKMLNYEAPKNVKWKN